MTNKAPETFTITRNRTGERARPSILRSLRAMTPQCQLSFDDTKQLAERQAHQLRQLVAESGHDLSNGVEEHHLTSLPRLKVVREALPTSGLSYWNGSEWVIVLNEEQSPARQRFTLFHEFKHILDHGAATRLYADEYQAERAADFFAGCVLMPKPALKQVFCNLTQNIDRLAAHFGASQQAIRVRLEQTGLVDPPQLFTRQRCARPVSTPTGQDQRFRTVAMTKSYM